MIDKNVLLEMRQQVEDFWNQEVKEQWFQDSIRGKEFGHSIANRVDEKTATLLKSKYNNDIKYEHTKGRKKRPRSMGDVWIEFDNNGTKISHPINVKTGEADKKGRPNMVAMSKLLNALLKCKIDSYYLMVIKFVLPVAPGVRVVPKVYLVDMLDYLDCIHFDSGTGQIMMKESDFYVAVDKGDRLVSASTEKKIQELIEEADRGAKRLFKNRINSIAVLEKEHEAYKKRVVRNLDQSSLNLFA